MSYQNSHTLLNIENLKKSYAGKPVVDGLDFHVLAGEVVGLLGPNGAGKTTAFLHDHGTHSSRSWKSVFPGT